MVLAGSAIFFLPTAYAIPLVVQSCGGEFGAIVFATAISIAQLLCLAAAPLPVVGVMTVVLIPLAYQIMGNVPFTWIEKQDSFDEEDRGRIVGILNTALCVGQVVVAICVGPILEASSLNTAFIATASVSAAVVVPAMVVYSRCSL